MLSEELTSVELKKGEFLDQSLLIDGQAPKNEKELVALFASLSSSHLGFSIRKIRRRFPDCIAYRGGQRLRIEFEFQSRNFKSHHHRASGCDLIVCWHDNWGDAAPARLEILELRTLFNSCFNVWFQPCAGQYAEQIGEIGFKDHWSVPSRGNVGDLILMYRTRPDAFFGDLFQIDSPVKRVRAGWKNGYDWMADITRVGTLNHPVTWDQMKAEKRLKHAGFMNGAMAGRPPVAPADWRVLVEMIVSRNHFLSWLKTDFNPSHVNSLTPARSKLRHLKSAAVAHEIYRPTA
jgi:hypothetical protein